MIQNFLYTTVDSLEKPQVVPVDVDKFVRTNEVNILEAHTFLLVPHIKTFPFITRRGRKLLATSSGNNTVRPKGNHFPPHHPPCVRERKVRCVRRRARACMYAYVNACATLPLLLDTCRSSLRPHHKLLLIFSSTRAAPPHASCFSRFSSRCGNAPLLPWSST